jgi:cell division protein FtsB
VAESEAAGLSPKRGWLWIGPLAALVGAAFALLYDADNGLRAMWGVKGEIRQVEDRLSVLWSERARLVKRAERLRTDPFEIESVARESLGMVRPGEIVVRLRTGNSQPD